MRTRLTEAIAAYSAGNALLSISSWVLDLGHCGISSSRRASRFPRAGRRLLRESTNLLRDRPSLSGNTDHTLGPFRLSAAGTVAVLLSLAAGLLTTALISAVIATRHTGVVGPSALLSAIPGWRTWRFIVHAAAYALPVLVCSLMIERWFPIVSAQSISRGFCFDALWFIGEQARLLTWIPLSLAMLLWVKRLLVGDYELFAPAVMPRALLWVIGILVGDFLAYLSHIARHRFDWLWNFHAVHHSQRELNFFTQHRFHDVDTLANLMLTILPLVLISPSVLEVGIYNTIALIHFRLYHCPIRSNYGALRYILVTPQSHRIHHASAPRLQKSNFGIFFSIWDHIFGTQYSSYGDFPDQLGLLDRRFPVEQDASLGQFAGVYAAQLIYPFLVILGWTGAPGPSREPPHCPGLGEHCAWHAR